MDSHSVLIGRNLISNESFEDPPGYNDVDPYEWWSWNSDLNGVTKEEHRIGNQSAYFSCPYKGESEGMAFTYRAVTPGREYTFNCYVRNSIEDPMKGNAYGQISIKWQRKKIVKDKDGNDKKIDAEIKCDWGPKFGPELHPFNWALVTMSATAPEGAESCNFAIEFFNKGGSGKFFVDDVSAEEINAFFQGKDEKVKTTTREKSLPLTPGLKSGSTG